MGGVEAVEHTTADDEPEDTGVTAPEVIGGLERGVLTSDLTGTNLN